MSRLHVFDMDGTLLCGTTASLEVARRLGCVPELVDLEGSLAAGELDTRGFAAAICRLWGALTPEDVARAFDDAPWIGGLHEVLADIRARGEHSLVITMSPDFFAERLHGVGVDEVVASRFPPPPFDRMPDPAGILSPDSKLPVVDEVRSRWGLRRDHCSAYGDSVSDLPLFRSLRHTIAVNAGPRLREVALLSYDGTDLYDAYQMGRAHLDGHGSAADPPAVQR